MYADFRYYTDNYYGNQIDEADSNRLLQRASDYIDSITFGRIVKQEPIMDSVKNATCAVAEVIKQGEESNAMMNDGIIQSESNDGFSQSRVVNDTSSVNGMAALEKRKYSAAYQYLVHSGLLYGGVSVC